VSSKVQRQIRQIVTLTWKLALTLDLMPNMPLFSADRP
jgi:hypothetical protein